MKKLLWAALAVLAFGTTSGCIIDDTYSVCNTTDDCSDLDDVCLGHSVTTTSGAIISGNFCSHGCIDDFDCESSGGFVGACYDLFTDNRICYQTCIDDFDCFLSSVCLPVVDPGGTVTDFICVPDN